jgi:glycosyltransferase involved in cell wall biosynthesis
MSSRLHVVVDDRPLRKALTGVGNYIAQLLLRLPEFAPEIDARPFHLTHLRPRDWRAELTAAADDSRQSVKDVGGLRVPWIVRRALQGGYDAAFRWKTRGYELYHEPNHVPIRCGLPTVTTIHDLSVLVHPDWHPADRVKWYETSFPAGIRQTRHFLAASQFTKNEMMRLLNVPPERITVTYQAARDPFVAAGAAARRGEQPTGPIPNVPERFFLYVGTLEPRKNIEGLLDAYAALPAPIRERHTLLIVGAWGWKAERIREQLEARRLGGQVRLVGYLHDPTLAALYARCTALVWPTWYEGFGLPPLEALACGARVIVSNVASLPEVVGNAGVLLDPRDVAAWTEAMRAMAEDDGGRATAREKAIAQAERFTWREFIRDTVGGYRTALNA